MAKGKDQQEVFKHNTNARPQHKCDQRTEAEGAKALHIIRLKPTAGAHAQKVHANVFLRATLAAHADNVCTGGARPAHGSSTGTTSLLPGM